MAYNGVKADRPQIVLTEDLVKEIRILMELLAKFSADHNGVHISMQTWNGGDYAETTLYDCDSKDGKGFWMHKIDFKKAVTNFLPHEEGKDEANG